MSVVGGVSPVVGGVSPVGGGGSSTVVVGGGFALCCFCSICLAELWYHKVTQLC